jgi:hypothetical protein
MYHCKINNNDQKKEKMVKKTRRIFNQRMRAIIQNPQDPIQWKKFILLPSILFTPHNAGKKKVLRSRLQILEDDDWDSLTLQHLLSRRQRHQISSIDFLKIRDKRVQSLAKAGEMSSIMQLIFFRLPRGDRHTSSACNVTYPCFSLF